MSLSRSRIIKILINIDNGALLSEELDKIDDYNYAYINKIVRGVLEKRISIDEIISNYSNIRINKLKPFIKNILRAAIYELAEINKATDYGVVNDYVNIVKKSKFNNLKGYVNAILRNIASGNINLYISYPKWIMNLLVEDIGENNLKLLLNNTYNKISYRVRSKDLITSMSEKYDISYSSIVDNCIYINDKNKPSDIDEFNDGKITVQDPSSIYVGNIAYDIFKDKDKKLILDLCAAPGGKTSHLADIPNSKIISCDISDKKIEKIKENLSRMHISNVDCRINDATIINKSFIDKFDLVLCDLPCSGLGVMSKKPDIKFRLLPKDIEELSRIQRKILSNAIRYLKKDGYLIFSTCTLTKKENIDNFNYINEILENVYIDGLPYKQFIQGRDSCDGFFVSVFRR